MSSVYINEPNTSGKVIIHTTYGDLEVELWCKEAPKATLNFLQLALEGYYDNTIVHRIVPNFIVQCGDPTGTGVGGESIYGGPFSTELHSRLKFNRRGLLGAVCMEEGGIQSQFFLTLDAAAELNGKNTLFGKIVGDTIFNLLKMGEVELDNERPIYPPLITSVSVLFHPFDITPRKKAIMIEAPVITKKAVKKNSALLSFDEDESSSFGKIKSSHDVLKDKKLSKKVAVEPSEMKEIVRNEKSSNVVIEQPVEESKKESKLASMKREIEKVKRQIKKIDKAEEQVPQKQLSFIEQQKLLYKSKPNTIVGKRRKKNNDEAVLLSKILSFRDKLRGIEPEEQEQKTESIEEACRLHAVINCKSCKDTFGMQVVESEQGWLAHKLIFDKEVGHKDTRNDPYQLVVIDPKFKK